MNKMGVMIRRGARVLSEGPLGSISGSLCHSWNRLLPERYVNWFLRRMIAERLSHFRTAWTSVLHHPAHLWLPRFDRQQIEDMVAWARHRFPDADFYVLSDLAPRAIPYPFANHGMRWLQNIRAVQETGQPRVFFCIFESDERLADVLRAIMCMSNAFYYTPKAYLPTARVFHRDHIAWRVLREAVPPANKLDTFDLADYENIIQALQVTRNLPGAYVEIGVYKGASAHLALNYLRSAGIDRHAFFLDVFEGFSYDEAKSSPDAFWLGQFCSTSMDTVKRRLAAFENKTLVKCNIITDELPGEIDEIAVCNIDVDIYEAITAALNKTAPRIVGNGVILVEDQGHTPNIAGGYLALKDFLASPLGRHFVPWNLSSGQAVLIRK
ncbi:MAG: hypothetical protein KAY24_09050 [Candidatus Eisenbacteria sp.]|nr:hypothetical protein [Candidatus Eisenbacteria bacterium]